MTEEFGIEPKPVDVFTHSSTGFPGAWSEEEVAILLNTWREVLETARPTTRRFDVAQRILRRLRSNRNFRRVEKEDIKKQIGRLRTEYKVYQGLLKIGIKTVRPPCVDQMEVIFDKIPSARKRLDSTDGGNHDGLSEDSDHSRRLSVSYDGEDNENRQRTVSDSTRRDEATTQRPRVRFFQRRMSLQGLVRVVVGQQRTLLDRLDKLLKCLEDSNSRVVTLMENMVLNKAEPSIGTFSTNEEKADSA
ncbi:uncharacterized protein LOC129984385 isoform X2 [Argiope bruennichi]|uniref:Uncharacterized protein n=1 Tax=Argiope bruennichi TaxID=94029 RepID=A0A8T0EK54_ARGBR|nr:uncharacterized protein LOC129984385 isoform X2 [Argiope bruennichi]KAF8773901.1 hypothetical protein HNY73_016511 [Argiope bruennichi]